MSLLGTLLKSKHRKGGESKGKAKYRADPDPPDVTSEQKRTARKENTVLLIMNSIKHLLTSPGFKKKKSVSYQNIPIITQICEL